MRTKLRNHTVHQPGSDYKKKGKTMNALDYLCRYKELKANISALVARAAVAEQLARRHDDKDLRKQAEAEAEDCKKTATAMKEEQNQMEKVIWGMPQDRARVLRLHYFDGDDLRTIARTMHRNLDFVENLKNEGLRNLQRILDMKEKREQQ